ncbi:DUF397 domain-containing protein [Streptomyces sp. NPDC048442]|uniref:DUF397 domain-containing protein n=1 Tax=Streptomyces sp. NPDC048442 TaxID=3154823 RepID=UPI003413F418
MNTEALNWFKSSYSGGAGGDCLEVAYDWRKSSYSGGAGGECVEVAAHPTTIHVRDSKLADASPQFGVSPTAWTAFVSYARS